MTAPVAVEGIDQMEMFQLLRLRSALKLELLGLKHSQGSVYAHVKREYGFKGNRARVLEQLSALISEKTGGKL